MQLTLTNLQQFKHMLTSLVTEKDVVATVVAGKTAGEYAVTLTKGEAKAEKTIAVTFDFAADDRFVTEVNAIERYTSRS